jgi:hypothetical protein
MLKTQYIPYKINKEVNGRLVLIQPYMYPNANVREPNKRCFRRNNLYCLWYQPRTEI